MSSKNAKILGIALIATALFCLVVGVMTDFPILIFGSILELLGGMVYLAMARGGKEAAKKVLMNYVPRGVAILLFLITTAFFFKPLVFEGKRVKQGDIEHHEGMSKEIVDFRNKEGREPLWTNSMFGGMPAYQISTRYPSDLMNPLQIELSDVTRIPFPVTSVLLCMIGFYFLLITFKVNPWVSIAGALAFGFTSYMITLVPAGHNSKMYAIAYMAPVIMGVIMTFRGKFWLGIGLTAFALAMEINANHLQITYYLLILLLFIGIGETVRLILAHKYADLSKAVGGLIVAVVLAILPNMSNIMLTNEYSKYTTRGASDLTIDAANHQKTEGLSIDYATQWCYGIDETFTLMIPDVVGGASQSIKDYDESALDKVDPGYAESIGYQPAYFGEVIFTSGPYYVGAIICFLAVFAMFIMRDKIKWYLFGATVLAIMLAWGHNFMWLTEFFFNNIPGYDKFRAVSMILVIVNLTLPLLAMLGVKEFMDHPDEVKKKMKFFWISLGLTGGICFLFAVMPGSLVTTVNEAQTERYLGLVQQQGGTIDQAYDFIAQLEIAREAVVSSDAWRSLLLILCGAAIVWTYMRYKYHVAIVAVGLIFFIGIDMITVGRRYIDKDNYEKSKTHVVPYVASAADQLILQDKDPSYRVLNLTVDVWQDASTSYFHKSIGGYHGAKLKRIQELYEIVLEKQINEVQTAMRTAFGGGAMNGDSIVQASLAKQSAINMFNIKYVIFNPDGGVITNKSACGSAWFVDDVKVVANADVEITELAKIDPHNVAVVDQKFQAQLGGYKPHHDSTATVKLISHAPDKIEYESNAASDGVIMFPEVYYPEGWNVTVNGQPAEYFCGNFILRGMHVPAGKNKIVFEFHPESYYSGESIAMVGSLLVFFVLIGGIVMEVLKGKPDEEDASKEIPAENLRFPESMKKK